ncbi:B2L15 protein, partial [Hemiprocne comata]|nr:B2L15 protein [Hemiprocne comata]
TAMTTFEEQTECIVEALFSDLFSEDETQCRSLETDGGGSVQAAAEPPAKFDPVLVASRLRQMGDQCNLDFERVSSEDLVEVLNGKVKCKCRNLTEYWILSQDLFITLSFIKKLKLLSQFLQMEKFEAAVHSLSRSWRAQNPQMAYEIAFLSVSVKLLMHVAKKVPAMVRPSQLVQVINGNSQVRSYIEACGGWVRV